MSLLRPSITRVVFGLALAWAVSACDGSDKERAAAETRPEDRPGPMVVREREATPQPPAATNAAAAEAEVAAAAEAAGATARKLQLANCAEGIVLLQTRANAFRGPAAERNARRAEVDTALAAYRTGEPGDCLRSLSGAFAALGYSFAPHTEEVACANGLIGTISQLTRLRRDFERQEVQVLIDAAAAALEAGDLEGCYRSSSAAFVRAREFLEQQ